MNDRILALVAVAVLAAALWIASRAYRIWLRRAPAQDAALDGLGLPRDGLPVVLGFSAEYCLPCKTQQRPALERLRESVGMMLHVLEVDALEHSDLAARYGVLTVPSTVVLDGRRGVIAINYGVTSADKLLAQVQPALASTSSHVLNSA
jgi:thioredoxin 1